MDAGQILLKHGLMTDASLAQAVAARTNGDRVDQVAVRLGLVGEIDALRALGVETGVDRWRSKAHVAYQVDDLAAWRDKLAAIGVEALESVPIPGFDRFECRDPFGNRMEFIQPL